MSSSCISRTPCKRIEAADLTRTSENSRQQYGVNYGFHFLSRATSSMRIKRIKTFPYSPPSYPMGPAYKNNGCSLLFLCHYCAMPPILKSAGCSATLTSRKKSNLGTSAESIIVWNSLIWTAVTDSTEYCRTILQSSAQAVGYRVKSYLRT
jgi:hypothetical protein